VVVVAIDDKSIGRLGRWPWPRERLAQLVNILSKGGAKVIGFDLIFSEPEVPYELRKIKNLKKVFTDLRLKDVNNNSSLFYQEIVNAEKEVDNDKVFAESIKMANNVILPMFFTLGDGKVNKEGENREKIIEAKPFLSKSHYTFLIGMDNIKSFPPLNAKDVSLPISLLSSSCKRLGHVNFRLDADGSLRWEPLVIGYNGDYYPVLNIQMVREYLGLEPEGVKLHFGEGIELGSIYIPTDEQGRMLINYYGPNGTFPFYSFSDVLDGTIPGSVFHDKIVLIGYAAVGLGDLWVTPFSVGLYGVEKHANIIANILHQDILTRANWMVFLDLFFIVLFGLVLGIFIHRNSALRGSIFALFVSVSYLAIVQYLFVVHKMWLNIIYPILTIILTYTGVTIFRFLTEEREKKKIRGAFQQYLNPSVVNEVLKDPKMLKLGGEKRDLTVLFSDIRGFTSISENMSPEALVHLLNEYLTVMTDIVLTHDGLLDKYMGDAIMAVYGAPVPQTDHHLRACITALDMIESLKKLQEKWESEGVPRIDIGIGINSGPMVVGNMGSEKRFDYTVMGDNVNLASRLEGINKEYGTTIILSEYTLEHVKDLFLVRELDLVRVKGKKEPIRIYELMGRKDASLEESVITAVTLFEKGLDAYKNRQWDTGIEKFQKVLEVIPADLPSKLYIKRCMELKDTPPQEDWDGVCTMLTK